MVCTGQFGCCRPRHASCGFHRDLHFDFIWLFGNTHHSDPDGPSGGDGGDSSAAAEPQEDDFGPASDEEDAPEEWDD